MSHHSSQPNPEMSAAMRRLFGEFPDGKLNENDAGALAVEIGTEGNSVVIRFPKPVAWIGFTGDQAIEIAQTLIKHARRVGVTSPLILRVGE